MDLSHTFITFDREEKPYFTLTAIIYTAIPAPINGGNLNLLPLHNVHVKSTKTVAKCTGTNPVVVQSLVGSHFTTSSFLTFYPVARCFNRSWSWKEPSPPLLGKVIIIPPPPPQRLLGGRRKRIRSEEEGQKDSDRFERRPPVLWWVSRFIYVPKE